MPTAPDNHDAHDYAERIRERSHKGRLTLQQKNLSEKPLNDKEITDAAISPCDVKNIRTPIRTNP
jgi:hypothetical protein